MNYYERIQKSIDYIEDNLENDIVIEKAAEEAFMSMSGFYRLFFAIAGYSVKEYIRLRRLSEAANILTDRNIRIIDIAVKYLYDSADSFSRAFKNVTGFLPSEFRNKGQNFIFERIDIMDKYFEIQDKGLLEKYPDIKVLKELKPMRAAYYCYYGKNPEANAFQVICQWMNKTGIQIDEQKFRIFGYNNPSPSSPDQEEYGYEVCVTIDEDTLVEDDKVKIKTLEGGLYAVISVKREDSELGNEIVDAWERFQSWLKDSKYAYGGHQWLEEHLGFDENLNHIGGVDLYMPIVEKVNVDTSKSFQIVEPMWVASFQATGKNAAETAREYFFKWAESENLFGNGREHRVFAYYSHEKMGTDDFFFKINVTVDKDFKTNDKNIELYEFKAGYYAVMKSKYKYNGWAWGEFIKWVNKNEKYTVGDYWFFEEYLMDTPQINLETDMLLYMPVKEK